MGFKRLSQTKIVFSATALAGVVIHGFFLLNILNNHDTITFNPTGAGSGIKSGRWFLAFLHFVAEKFNLVYTIPYVNGIIAILLICVAMCLLMKIFQIKNTRTAVLFGILFIAFPTFSSTLFYCFTTIYYSIAVICTIVAVGVTEQYKWGFLLAPFFIAFSTGIYQAYYPMAITLFVLMVLKKVLEPDSKFLNVLKKGMLYVAILLSAMGIYFVIMKLSLWITGIGLVDYQGINTMGNINLLDFPQYILNAFWIFLRLPFQDYCKLTAVPVIKFLYGCTYGISIVLLGIILYERKKKWYMILETIGIFLCLPIAMNSIQMMCPNSVIYTLMVYPIVFVFFVPVILFNELEQMNVSYKQWIMKVVTIVLLLTTLNYIWTDNGNYTLMWYSNKQVASYYTTMVTRIKSLEGYDDRLPMVFIGDTIEDDHYQNFWAEISQFSYGGNDPNLVTQYSWKKMIRVYTGFTWEKPEGIRKLKQKEEVMNMPCYPDDGSMKIVDNIIIVKVSEEE